MVSQFIERLDFYPARLKNTFVDRHGAVTGVDRRSVTGVSGPGRDLLRVATYLARPLDLVDPASGQTVIPM